MATVPAIIAFCKTNFVLDLQTGPAYSKANWPVGKTNGFTDALPVIISFYLVGMNMSFKNAIRILLGLFSAVILFHICIVLKIIPYEIAWGGRLKNDTEMYVFECVSIVLNVFLCCLLLMKGGYWSYKFPGKIVHAILWCFFILFMLNTIGNLFAKTVFEKLFSVLTGLAALLLWKILKGEKQQTAG